MPKKVSYEVKKKPYEARMEKQMGYPKNATVVNIRIEGPNGSKNMTIVQDKYGKQQTYE